MEYDMYIIEIVLDGDNGGFLSAIKNRTRRN